MNNVAKYDSVAQIHMTSIRQYIALKEDPEFRDCIPWDIIQYVDLEKTRYEIAELMWHDDKSANEDRMTIGYTQSIIVDGSPVDTEHDEDVRN
jgi:hypothetical protein